MPQVRWDRCSRNSSQCWSWFGLRRRSGRASHSTQMRKDGRSCCCRRSIESHPRQGCDASGQVGSEWCHCPAFLRAMFQPWSDPKPHGTLGQCSAHRTSPPFLLHPTETRLHRCTTARHRCPRNECRVGRRGRIWPHPRLANAPGSSTSIHHPTFPTRSRPQPTRGCFRLGPGPCRGPKRLALHCLPLRRCSLVS